MQSTFIFVILLPEIDLGDDLHWKKGTEITVFMLMSTHQRSIIETLTLFVGLETTEKLEIS